MDLSQDYRNNASEKLCTQSSFQWRLKKTATLNLPISVGALAAFCFSFPIFHPDSWKIKTSGKTIADTTETSDSKSFKASKPGIANSLGNPDPHPSCLCQPFVEVPHTSLKCIFDEYRFFNYTQYPLQEIQLQEPVLEFGKKLETTSTEILRLRDIQITGKLVDPSKNDYSVSLP